MIHLMLRYVEVSAFLGLTFDTDCRTEHIIWFAGSIFRAVHNRATAVPMALKTNLARQANYLSHHARAPEFSS